MAKKIKVYLQYPWKFPDSPYYKYIIENPPKGIIYLNSSKQKGVITNFKFFRFSNILKKIVRHIFRALFPSFPNAHLTKDLEGVDLIHCAHCLSKNKDFPWVADIEYASQLWVAGSTPKNKNMVRKILLRKNCKKIISWTERMKKELIEKIPEIENKIEVIYPNVPILTSRKRHKGINLLFVARYFYEKGGLHALEVMDVLTKKYDDVNGIIISVVPEEIRAKYKKNKKIKFVGLLPQKKLIEEYYPLADIFVYPGYSDSFGFAIPEMLGIGVPVVSVAGSSRSELIDDGKTGYIIPTRFNQDQLVELGKSLIGSKNILHEMVKKTSKLIENHKLREKMSKNAKEVVRIGKFSIAKNNKKLRKVYMEALK